MLVDKVEATVYILGYVDLAYDLFVVVSFALGRYFILLLN